MGTMSSERFSPPEILSEEALRAAIRPGPITISVIEDAFRLYAEGAANMPPIVHVDIPPNGNVDVKGAYIHGLPNLTIKIGSGFFDNPSIGLPSSGSVMVVLSAKSGHCEAVLLENGYLTDLRTGLAGAVAARHLAPPGPLRIGVVGTGAQARMQLRCIAVEQDIQSVQVLSRTLHRANDFAEAMAEELGLKIDIANDAVSFEERCNLIITPTPAVSPVLPGERIGHNCLVIAVGADAPGKRELPTTYLEKAELLVCDSIAQCTLNGELQYWNSNHETLPQRIVELGKVIAGGGLDRSNVSGLIVCDLTGLGVQDTAIAAHALKVINS